MTPAIHTIIIPVKDVARARSLYGTLSGVQPSMDAPNYVAFDVGGQHIGLDPNGHRHGMTAPIGYWHVTDIQKSLKELVDAGAEVQQAVRDVGGGRLIATVKDPDDNVIGLLQPGEHEASRGGS